MYKSIALLSEIDNKKKDHVLSDCDSYTVQKDGVVEISRNSTNTCLFNSNNNKAIHLSNLLYNNIFKKDIISLDDIGNIVGNENASVFLSQMIRDNILYNSGVVCGEELKKEKYIPTLLISPSSKCNLQCIYCYSNANDAKGYIDEEYYKVAINDTIGNIIASDGYTYKKFLGNTQQCRLAIIGGGEPTVNENLFIDIVKYFSDQCRAQYIEPVVAVTTNGTLSSKVCDILCEYKSEVMVSIDGSKDVHNMQRPFIGGKNSYDIAISNIAKLLAGGCYVVMRSTVTRHSLKYISNILDVALANKIQNIQIEPLNETGRAKDNELLAPYPEEFCDELTHLFIRARGLGISLKSNQLPISLKKRTRFCGACGTNKIVTISGYISACTEVTEPSDPYSKYFFSGKIDLEKQKIVINKNQVDRLSYRYIDNMDVCNNCVMRFNCAGGCPARALRANGDMYSPDKKWCDATVNMSIDIIKKLLY